VLFTAPLSISTPYVSGSTYEKGCRKIGSESIGKNSPQRNIIGKRKKLEKVCASNTSLTDTAIKSPRKVDAIAIRSIAGSTTGHEIVEMSVISMAIITGTIALTEPKNIAPDVFAIINIFRDMGASSSRSKEWFFFSNVTVTASIDVVPKSTEMAITPGSSSGIVSNPLPDFIKNIPVHAIGNIRPQLILGGFR
jgi:hypothetical protein